MNMFKTSAPAKGLALKGQNLLSVLHIGLSIFSFAICIGIESFLWNASLDLDLTSTKAQGER
jgi:hypothetical protein